MSQSTTSASHDDLLEVAIVGSGFAGLAMAISLKQADITNFRIYERASELGGTWRDNQYPGAACDVQSHLYSYSFEPNPLWSRMFAPATEIQDYVLHCIRKYDLRRHTTVNTTIVSSEWLNDQGVWRITTHDDQVIHARSLVTGTGGLSQPNYADIPGLDSFKGRCFHSATWDHSFDLRGKRVAVVGTGASAIQIVPAIADQVSKLTVFQRTPAWVLPKPDREISPREQHLYARIPALQKLQRARLYTQLDPRSVAFAYAPALMKPVEWRAKMYIRSIVNKRTTADALTPSYTIGCKRILMSNDYYQAFNKPNVRLETGSTGAIRSIIPEGVVTQDGRVHEVDAIIMCTGFQSADALAPFEIRGRYNRTLDQAWGNNAEAYKGTTVHGFPNMYMLVGPNTGLGHSSMILMIEAQVKYASQAIQFRRSRGLQSLDVTLSAQKAYNAAIHKRLDNTVWATGCGAWYTNSEGRNTTLWPGSTTEFKWMMRHFDESAYRKTPHARVVPVLPKNYHTLQTNEAPLAE